MELTMEALLELMEILGILLLRCYFPVICVGKLQQPSPYSIQLLFLLMFDSWLKKTPVLEI